MVLLFLILFDADVLLLLIFSNKLCKLFLLTQGLVKSFLTVTALLGNKNIEKEWGGKYYTAMVLFWLLIFDADVFATSIRCLCSGVCPKFLYPPLLKNVPL